MSRYFLFTLFAIAIAVDSYGQAEPTNHVTGFAVSGRTSSSISLTWTGATGAQTPDGYLIVVTVGTTTFPAAPTDAVVEVDDFDLSDNIGQVNVTHGVGTNNYTFTNPPFITVNPQTRYNFRIYPYKTGTNINYKVDGTVPALNDIRTLSLEPSGHSATFTATLNGDTQIDLAFAAASTLTNADGYVIYRKAGVAANLAGLNDGAAPPSALTDGQTLLIATTNAAATAYSDAGLTGGVTYHYVIVPYNFDGTNNPTHNFLTDGSEPRANATTNLVVTIAQIASGGGSNIATSPLSSSSSNQAILGFSITTNGPTTFSTLNVPVTSSTTLIGKVTNPRIFSSADAIFGGDASINTGTVTASQLQFTGIATALTAGTTNYFIVVDVSASVNSTTATIQPSFTETNIAFTSPVATPATFTVTGDTYSFVDTNPPTLSSTNPANNATGISVKITQFTITFNEDVTHIGDNSDNNNRIIIYDDDANANRDTIELADISVTGNVVTFTTSFAFLPNTNYDIIIGNSVFQDLSGNPFAGLPEDAWDFDTELVPNISSLSNTTRCIGDQLTISGSRFTGTGGSGNTKPRVFINGVQVPDGNVTAFSSSSITLTVPTGATSGNVTVENMDNNLVSNSSSLTVHPQINTGLTVTPATLGPAQNTSVNVDVSTTQSSNYTYTLRLTAAPGGYGTSPPANVDSDTGNNGTRTLNTTSLTHIGDYTYIINVSRTGCVTRQLTNTPFTLTVASLNVTVSATSTTVCQGNSAILIGSTSGGTGFYQFAWTGPNGFSSNSSSPTITPAHPAGTGWYVCTLSDNSSNTDKDSVFITTFPAITATIEPAPTETTVRTEYTVENFDYRLYGNPTGGVFTGPGVTKKADGNYYFNPQNAGLGSHTIVYTYTDGNNCSDSDSIIFNVREATVIGLDDKYCEGVNTDTGLRFNPSTFPSGWQFTRLVFYVYNVSTGIYCITEAAPTFPYCGAGSYNPLTVTSTINVTDIQTGLTVTRPNEYSLNIAGIRQNYGYTRTVTGQQFYFYVLVYGKNALGVEQYLRAQYFEVLQNEAPPQVVGIVERENVCSDATSISLTSSIAAYTITGFSISPSTYSAALSGTNNSQFDPGHSSFPPEISTTYELPLTITMAYADRNNCPSSVNRNFTWIKKPSAPIANDTSYCQITTGNPGKFQVKSTPNGRADNPFWHDIDPGSNPSAPVLDSVNFVFTPSDVNGLTPTIKTYYVRQRYKGCIGSVESVNLEIQGAPNASFTVPSVCENKDFTIDGPKDGSTPYTIYNWSFGDGKSQSVNNDNFVTYNYGPNTGNIQFTIGLEVFNSDNCSNRSSATTTVGLNPIPDFTTDFVCNLDNTRFTATTNIPVSEFEWDFGDGSAVIGPSPKNDPAPEGGTYEIPRHTFTNGPGTYNVTVTSYTSIGCSSSKTKSVSILRYETYSTLAPYKMVDLDNERGFWTVQDISANANTTWGFGASSTAKINSSGENAWVTNPTGNYAPNERSFINSPCMDISAISKPVLTLKYASNTQFQFDGAVLEFSKDGGLTWNALGGSATGINWFNTPAFFSGIIGNSTVGWSGDRYDSTTVQGSKIFLEAKHAIDNVSGLQTPADRTKLRFRMAFASNGDGEFEGFAFNKVSIESRNRNLLVENFTQGLPANSANNSAYNTIDPSETVKVQYHVDFPGNDPISRENVIDPSARAAFYGITNNQNPSLIPRAYVDGYSGGNFTDGWDSNYRGLRSLNTSPYLLTIATLPQTNPDSLKFTITMDALVDINFVNRKPVLHVGVIEKVKGTNNNVLRKLLPNAAGSVVAKPFLATAPPRVLNYRWKPENPSIAKSQIALIAWVQDEFTKEVYQAVSLLNPDLTHLPDPSVITSIEDPTYPDKIVIYPNPANHEVNIVLPEAASTPTPIKLVDAQGRNVFEGEFKPGEQRKTIATTGFAGGVYILQLNARETIVRKKVMVVQQGN